MRNQILTALTVLFLILLSTPAAAGEVLQWVDAHGVISMTDDIRNIPVKYRSQIITIETNGLAANQFTRSVVVADPETAARLTHLRDLQRQRAARDQSRRDANRIESKRVSRATSDTWVTQSTLNPDTGTEVEEGIHPDDAVYPLVSSREWFQFGDRTRLVTVERDALGRLIQIHGAVRYSLRR